MMSIIGFANTPRHPVILSNLHGMLLNLKCHLMLQGGMSRGEERDYWLINIPPQDVPYAGMNSIALNLNRHVLFRRILAGKQ